jgi:hypothetical protein
LFRTYEENLGAVEVSFKSSSQTVSSLVIPGRILEAKVTYIVGLGSSNWTSRHDFTAGIEHEFDQYNIQIFGERNSLGDLDLSLN